MCRRTRYRGSKRNVLAFGMDIVVTFLTIYQNKKAGAKCNRRTAPIVDKLQMPATDCVRTVFGLYFGGSIHRSIRIGSRVGGGLPFSGQYISQPKTASMFSHVNKLLGLFIL